MSQQAMQQALSALKALRGHFPTDVDMVEAGYNEREVDEACTAFENAQSAIAVLEKELALHTTGGAGMEWRSAANGENLVDATGKIVGGVRGLGLTCNAYREGRLLGEYVTTEQAKAAVLVAASPTIEANDAKDAARYRFLKSWVGTEYGDLPKEMQEDPSSSEDLDRILDAAMSNHQPVAASVPGTHESKEDQRG